MGHETILEVHDFPQGKIGPMLFRMFLAGSGAKKLIVISNPLAADLTVEFGSKIRPPFLQVNPDAVDLERYADLPQPEDSRHRLISDKNLVGDRLGSHFSHGRFTVGYTGHLYKGRGISLILDIAKELPQVNFLIVGGEPQDVSRVQELVSMNRLENIFLLGFVPNADLPLYQSACEVLLMPYQGQVSASSGGNIAKYLSPMKLFEYLACGRAICASDLPVFRDVLSEENALLLPPRDVDSWVGSLQDLIDEPEKRNALAANAKLAASEYTWENRSISILAGI